MFLDIEIKKRSVSIVINPETPEEIRDQIEFDLNFINSLNCTLDNVFKIHDSPKFIDENLNPEGVYFSMATPLNTYKIPLHLIRSINGVTPSPGPIFDPFYIFEQYNQIFP
jgi:hypothetical protein